MAGKAKYQLTAGTVLGITSTAVATLEEVDTASLLAISTTQKEVSFTGGQKQDIDVTVLESEEQEMENGLEAPGELSLSGNWLPQDEGQTALRAADADNSIRGLKLTFKSGATATMLVQVRQETWSVQPNGVATGGFTLRVKGKPAYATADAGA
ncbi:phage tail protein [Salinicola endophyticus]|uniref:Phage tail protein n=1 Tax=Salinicola endophyticus TaxID=1949083 RepID=A0ABY8FEI2_9GAMM|nr:phage tail tube protein [Salinicola endophyticus]WFF40395.1 phage tail protein [Salinicola endophyticus]